jgi:hypothetical protein
MAEPDLARPGVTMRIFNTALSAVVGLSALVTLAFAAPREEHFQTRLSPIAMDLLTRDSVAGVGRATAVLSNDTLTLSGVFEGLPTAVTSANLHQGIAVGARGQLAFKLAVSGSRQGVINGSVRLSKDQAAALRSGRMYVQLQSEGAPDGHLWGWLLPAPTPADR